MLVFNLLFLTSQSLVIYLYTYIPLPRSDLKPMFQKEISPPIDCWKLLPKLFVIFHMYSPASSTWSPKCPKPQYYRELFYDGQMLWARLYTVWSSVFSGTLWLLSIWWSRWHSLPLITVQLRNQFLTKKSFLTNPLIKWPGQKGVTSHRLKLCSLIVKNAIFPFFGKYVCVIGHIGPKITTSSPVLFWRSLTVIFVMSTKFLKNPDFN